MNGLLEQLLHASRSRRAERIDACGAPRASFRDAVAGRGALSLIAEFKRRSPSSPQLATAAELGPVIRSYVDGGARALSVLTEPTRFGGRLADLRDAVTLCELPVLRKDFLVRTEQVVESAAIGASAVLLIARALAGNQLAEMVAAARELGLDVLLECHDDADLDRALPHDDVLIGINNRDLDTLAIDRGTVLRLLPKVPADRIVVAESGYRDAGELREVVGRVDAVLVGTALMTGADVAAFGGAGRRS